MTTTLAHPETAEQLITLDPITRTLPLPLGESRGEGHQMRSRTDDSPPPPQGEGRGEGLAGSARAVAHDSGELATSRSGDLALPTDLLNRLLTLYTTHSNSFNDLCRELGLPMLELLDLLERPDVIRALERLAQANETRAKVLARVTSDAAVSALIDLMDTTDKPETRRKAAGAILRHGKPPAKSCKRVADKLPLPLGEGRGEGRQMRSRADDSPPPPREEGRGEGPDTPIAPTLRAAGLSPRSSSTPARATDSEDAAAEKSVLPLHPKPQTPDPKPDSQGASEETTTAHARPFAGVPP